MSFAYEVRRVRDDVLLVSGSTRHISVDHEGKVTLLPESLRDLLRRRAENP
jgi:acyl-CoA thioesterase FadM